MGVDSTIEFLRMSRRHDVGDVNFFVSYLATYVNYFDVAIDNRIAKFALPRSPSHHFTKRVLSQCT